MILFIFIASTHYLNIGFTAKRLLKKVFTTNLQAINKSLFISFHSLCVKLAIFYDYMCLHDSIDKIFGGHTVNILKRKVLHIKNDS